MLNWFEKDNKCVAIGECACYQIDLAKSVMTIKFYHFGKVVVTDAKPVDKHKNFAEPIETYGFLGQPK
jgi:hypothetical protein